MKLVTFTRNGVQAVGLWLDGAGVLDLSLASEMDGLPLEASNMLALIEHVSEHGMDDLRVAAKRPRKDCIYPFEQIELLAPIPRPSKNVFCVGRNYLEHVHEGDKMFDRKVELPTVPNFFTKAPTAVVGPEAEVRWPSSLTQAFDYEVELGVIIGKPGRDIPKDKALEHVFGYTIINDVTARDLQRSHVQWFKGKSLDTSCPMGPCIVTADAIGDPAKLELVFTLNGEERQRATTDMMIFDVPTIIESLSAGMTLETGDVIATGTPSGVGFAMEPKGLLKGGDVMACAISGIGVLRNTVVEV